MVINLRLYLFDIAKIWTICSTTKFIYLFFAEYQHIDQLLPIMTNYYYSIAVLYYSILVSLHCKYKFKYSDLMKYLVVSDIHGALPRLETVLDFFEKNSYDMLLILGDIVNYGPRNRIPEGIDGLGIAERLNKLADKIVAVRGNCDSEVDQMLLNFPCMSDYAMLVANNKRIFLTHGHKYNPEKRSPQGIDIFFYGHTHLWKLEKAEDGVVICNTGSITFPKGGNIPTFATIEEDLTINIRNLEGEVVKSMTV